MENGKLASLLTFVVGIAIGSNWPKLKQYLPNLGRKGQQMVETVIEEVEEKVGEVVEATKKIPSITKDIVKKPFEFFKVESIIEEVEEKVNAVAKTKKKNTPKSKPKVKKPAAATK